MAYEDDKRRAAERGLKSVQMWLPFEAVAALDAMPGSRAEAVAALVASATNGNTSESTSKRDGVRDSRLLERVEGLESVVAQHGLRLDSLEPTKKGESNPLPGKVDTASDRMSKIRPKSPATDTDRCEAVKTDGTRCKMGVKQVLKVRVGDGTIRESRLCTSHGRMHKRGVVVQVRDW